MEGFSQITYKGKQINLITYGNSKENNLQLIKYWEEEYSKCPPKSILGLVDVSNFSFDKEALNALNGANNRTKPKQKKLRLSV